MVAWQFIMNWKGCGRQQCLASPNFPGKEEENDKKKNLSKTWSLGQNLTTSPEKHEAQMLCTHPL
jgi:hypothetical protein